MTKPLNILIIEDNEGDREYIGEILKNSQGLSFKGVSTLKEGIEELKREVYDVILLDLFLPDVHGEPLTAFFELKYQSERLNLKGLAIIILTGLKDKDMSLWAQRSGAQDYFDKSGLDINSNGLVRAIMGAYERTLHINSLLQQVTPPQEIKQKQMEDPLEALNKIKRSLEDAARYE